MAYRSITLGYYKRDWKYKQTFNLQQNQLFWITVKYKVWQKSSETCFIYCIFVKDLHFKKMSSSKCLKPLTYGNVAPTRSSLELSPLYHGFLNVVDGSERKSYQIIFSVSLKEKSYEWSQVKGVLESKYNFFIGKSAGYRKIRVQEEALSWSVHKHLQFLVSHESLIESLLRIPQENVWPWFARDIHNLSELSPKQ